MKHLSLLLLSFALLFAGCSDDDDNPSAISIISSDVEFDAAGGTGTILYAAEGSVSASVDQTWVTLSAPANGSITYTVDTNSEEMARTAQITLTAGGESQTVAITQMGSILGGLESVYEVNYRAQTNEYAIYANSENITVTVADDWAYAYITDSKLIIVTEINTSDQQRSTTLTFDNGWKTFTAELIQGALILTDVSSITLDQPRTSYSFDVSEDISDVDASWKATSADSWLTVTTSGYTITATASANETGSLRRTELTITAGDVTVTIPVTQSGVTDWYEFFQGEWTLSYTKGSDSATVTLSPNSDGTGYIMSGFITGYDLELGYDSSTRNMTLLMQYIGRYSVYYTYACPWDNDQGYYTWLEGTGFNLVFNGDEENPTFTFEDNGAWGSYTAQGIYVYCFTSDTPSSSAGAGYLYRYTYLVDLHR